MPARLTLVEKGNCFVLNVGNQDTLPKSAFQIKFPPERTRGIGTQNRRKRESQADLMVKLLVETTTVRKTSS